MTFAKKKKMIDGSRQGKTAYNSAKQVKLVEEE